MNVTRRSFSFGIGGLFGLFSLPRDADAKRPDENPQRDSGFLKAEGTIQARLCGTPGFGYINSPCLCMRVSKHGYGILSVMIEGDKALQLNGAFAKGYLYSGQLLSITGTLYRAPVPVGSSGLGPICIEAKEIEFLERRS